MVDKEEFPQERWNFFALLTQGVARRVANELSSEKLVLPFLYAALGGAVLFTGLFAPIVILARLLAQFFGARLVGISRRGNGWLAGSTALTASVLVALATFSGSLPAIWLPVTFIAASALLGIGNGFGALVFQDMIGRILTDGTRIKLLFAIGASSGAMVIVATLSSQFINGFEQAKSAAADHVHLFWASTFVLLISSLAALAIREPARIAAADQSSSASQGYFPSLIEGSREIFQRSWFRRFVVARVLFLSVEMTLPFFAVHAATFHAQTAPSLSLFVIALSLGMIAGGLTWPKVSKTSIQLVMSLSALVAFGAAALAFLNHLLDGVQSPLMHAAMIFCLAFGTQGTLDASTAYVVRSSNDEERPYAISVSNLAAGLVGIGIALIAGLIAQERGAIIAIVVMASINIFAAMFARTLPNVWPNDLTGHDGAVHRGDR